MHTHMHAHKLFKENFMLNFVIFKFAYFVPERSFTELEYFADIKLPTSL